MGERSFPWFYFLIIFLLVVGVSSLGFAFSRQTNITGAQEQEESSVASPAVAGEDAQQAPRISEESLGQDESQTGVSNDRLENQPEKSVTLATQNGSRTFWTNQTSIAGFLSEAGITIQTNEQIYADGQPVPTQGLEQRPLPAEIRIAPAVVSVTIVDGQDQRVIETTKATVAELFAEENIILAPADQVNTAGDAPLRSGMVIEISRPRPLTIQVDGEIFHIQSQETSVANILAEMGIILGENDSVTPNLEANLAPGDTIFVQRGAVDTITADEAIPYQTIFQPSPDLDLDTKAVLSAGSPGILRRQIRIIYEDGQEVDRVVEAEWVEQEPINEVIGYGTNINLGIVDTLEGPREYWRVVKMRVTAYTAASSGKPADHPTYGITASGRPAGTGIVAVDPNVIPFRSEVFVPGYGVGFAGDTGGGIKGRWIDLGYDEDELQAWNGYVDVYYLTPIPEEINYLLPEVLP